MREPDAGAGASFAAAPLSEETAARMRACGMEKKNGAALPFSRLREVRITHKNMRGAAVSGALVVADTFAEAVCDVFRALYAADFPLESVKPVCVFEACDERSMQANNSSCYNPRCIAGTDILSIHSYGAAIDINPRQNPYIPSRRDQAAALCVLPQDGQEFINRSLPRPGMAEPVRRIFYEAGFTVWGGYWADRPDWHHFQTPRIVAELCALFTPENAARYFALSKTYSARFAAMNTAEEAAAKACAARIGEEAFLAVTEQAFREHRLIRYGEV